MRTAVLPVSRASFPALGLAGLTLGLAGLGGAGLGGCDTLTSETDHAVVTSVAVDPAEFLGTRPCSPNPGALQSYMAELVDRDTMTSIATSAPISCTLPVAFEQVVEDHKYFANIKVFDLPPEAVVATTIPLQTTTCGVDEGFAIVNADERTFIHGCIELTGPGTAVTSIDIDTASLVAKLGCFSEGSPEGQIKALRVSAILPATGEPPAGNLPDVFISCGQGPVSYGSGLAPNIPYRFMVQAFAPGSTEAGWVATCTAETIDGVRVDAACSPLSSFGTIEIDIATVLHLFDPKLDPDLVCGEGEAEVASYDVVFDKNTATEIEASAVPCTTSAIVGPAATGPHGGEITLRNSNGKRIAHAICFVDTKPGATVTAPCVQD